MKKPDGHIRVVPVSFAIEPSIRKQLKAIAYERDCTVSSLVRDLVIDALQRRSTQTTQATQTTQVDAANAVA